MSKLIVANWKMNPATVSDAIELAVGSDHKGVAIAAPFPFLSALHQVLKYATLAAQDVSWEKKGPFTGEVSASQLASVGVKQVIIGHSERRALGETDEHIGRKVAAAVAANLVPVLCVGESAKERDAGIGEAVVIRQLNTGLRRLKHPLAQPLLIAYEPVWAISTTPGAKLDTPKNAQRVAQGIKRTAERMGYVVKVLYGGSVDPENAAGFLKQPDISGALVGGASIKRGSITTIAKHL